MLGVGLGERGADRRGDHLGVALRDDREHVAHEVRRAPLPGRAISTALIACSRPVWASLMTQLHAAESAGLQAAQESCPERPVLGVADVEAENLSAAVGGDTGGDHHRLDQVVDLPDRHPVRA